MDRTPPAGTGDDPRPDRRREPTGSGLNGDHLVDLMTRVAQGYEPAFTELYDLTSRRIYGTVLKVLRSPEHAAEVTQEVYVETWQQAGKYVAGKGSVLAWMFTMAHRRAVDRVRSVSSEVARDERYTTTGLDRESDEVWDSVAQKFDVERAREALATLTPLQREAVQLAYWEGLTQSQISERLGVALGTVKTRIRDGLNSLRSTLGGAET